MANPMNTILQGDALAVLRDLPDESVQMCVTSPPYYALRDYGIEGQIGMEETPWEYIEKLVEVFGEVKRVLRPDGTCWINLGDSYANDRSWGGHPSGKHTKALHETERPRRFTGLPGKNLLMLPARVAIALQEEGWILRQDCIWHLPNAMPESVLDRPVTDYEHVFLFAKSPHYLYDHFAVREEGKEWKGQAGTFARATGKATHLSIPGQSAVSHRENRTDRIPPGRSKRAVWSIPTVPFPGEHYATFPQNLAETCILAGTSPRACERCGAPWERILETTPMKITHGPKAGSYGSRTTDGISGTMVAPAECVMRGWRATCRCPETSGSGKCIVLDPFMGAGTTAMVAIQHHRNWLGIELSPKSVQIARDRIATVQTTLWEEGTA